MKQFSAVIVVETLPDGSYSFIARVTGDDARHALARTALMLEAWSEDDAIRVSIRNPRTGDVAYVQGGRPLLALAKNLERKT
jgi:hypothetical protein